MRRARSDEDKRERREAILSTALGMYERDPSFGAFTMAALAAEAGLAKGTLYLYFRTKEEVFLALVERLFGEWFADVDARLERGEGTWTAAEGAAVLLESVRGRLTLVRLLVIQGVIVEQNVEHDAALAYKRAVLERMAATGSLLERRLPFLPEDGGARLLLHLHALVTGLWQLAEPSPVIRRVLDEPGMEAARVDFERELGVLLRAVLEGMERRESAEC